MMWYWVIGVVCVLLLVAAAMIAITRRTNRRTPEEVASFIENFLDGRGDAWDWDDFLARPINDPELDRIRKRCADIPELFPPASGEVYCGAQGVAEMRGMIDQLRAMQEEELFDPEKAAFLKFDELRDEHMTILAEHVRALPIGPPSDPEVNIMIRAARQSKLSAEQVIEKVRELIVADHARFYRDRPANESHMEIRYLVWRRGSYPDGVCIATALYAPGQPGNIIYAVSEVERIAEDVWLLYDNHTDAD